MLLTAITICILYNYYMLEDLSAELSLSQTNELY